MNLTCSRRDFIKSSASLAMAFASMQHLQAKGKDLLLAFSTLGCPDWSLPQITDFAVTNGFRGVEVRGILRELDLPKCKDFSPAQISSTLTLMADKNLRFVNLGSGATLHFREGNERRKNIDDAKRFIDLANKLSCPFIRVFPGNFPKEQSKSETIELIATGMIELGEYAKNGNVSVLMETHGDLLFVDDIEAVMKLASHKNVGLVWDILNMWVKTKESPITMYSRLKKYIKHTHLKNAKIEEDKITYTRLATGDVPIFEAIDLLKNDGYKGFYSFEWEKLWHPELEAPEFAIADYATEMRKERKIMRY